ncbi:MAG TPA: amylo-alpha-1,6-glucosidase, partial [Thermoanaerobaculia bacterium]|nr:amylo-alpha-1,6-glucosidase [Thermoanaerobaculia bacterium]
YEWLETNGLGGWASSTVSGALTRRYHGLLVAATEPPVGRMVLLSKLDETVSVGGASFALSANQYPGAVAPRGFELIESFRHDLFPIWVYRLSTPAGGVRIEKTVAALDGENTTLVLYEVLAAPAPVSLALRPFYAGRDYHSLAHENPDIHREGAFADGVFRFAGYEVVPAVFVAVPGGTYAPAADWYRNFELQREAERGLDFREDLFTPGVFTVALAAGERLGVMIATGDPAGRDAWALLERERRRREGFVRRFVATTGCDEPFCRTLALAADQFIVRRWRRAHPGSPAPRIPGAGEQRTILAGYHWFADWGRDTMISLPGLCLLTGRFDEAREILRAFAAVVDRGMVPNRFPDRGEEPEYNSADASLWLFVAVHRFLEATGDDEFVRREMLPVLDEILAWHERGTRHNIHEDADGLLYAGEPGIQLTWMDVKIGDWVVTPRRGKPVEVNALWYNALAIAARLAERLGRPEQAARLARRAARVRERFIELYWNEATGWLLDCVDGEERDATLRPNQLLALSLPFPLLEGPRARSVLQVVEAKLLTPVGLRSLAPGDPRYRPTYGGSAAERDAAYHQGTVWPWLLGPFLTALVRLRGESGRAQARALLAAFAPHLWEAGVGTVSEIFDAEPPHAPHGCIAQAWSVAELLRAAVEDAGLGRRPTAAAPAAAATGGDAPIVRRRLRGGEQAL